MNPLEQLRDIHSPETIDWWPLAYGWWLLLIVLVLAVATGVYTYLSHRKRSAARRAALTELTGIDATADNWPHLLNQLLKRASLSYFPSHQVAGLHLKGWTDFQVSLLPQSKRHEFRAIMTPLQQSLYNSQPPTVEFEQAIAQARIWLNCALPPKHPKGGQDV